MPIGSTDRDIMQKSQINCEDPAKRETLALLNYFAAMVSISTLTPKGNSFTAKAALAGGFSL